MGLDLIPLTGLSFDQVTSSICSQLLITAAVPRTRHCAPPALFGKGFGAPRHSLARFMGWKPTWVCLATPGIRLSGRGYGVRSLR